MTEPQLRELLRVRDGRIAESWRGVLVPDGNRQVVTRLQQRGWIDRGAARPGRLWQLVLTDGGRKALADHSTGGMDAPSPSTGSEAVTPTAAT